MSDCGKITIGSEYDCLNPLQGGLTDRLILFNFDDVTSTTQDSEGKITAISLASGTSGYAFNGFKSNNAQEEAVSLGSGQTLFKHQVNFFIFDISQAQKNNIQKMAIGKFIAIIQNSKKDAKAFEVYGLGNGLELPAGVLRNHNENNGAFNITLATRDGQAEAKLPQTFLTTDYSTTLTTINGYLYEPAVTNVSPISVLAAGGTAVTVTGLNFFGGTGSNNVSSVKWIKQSDLTEVNQTGLTVSSDTTITFTSVALTAATYKVRVTTSKGSADSVVVVTSA